MKTKTIRFRKKFAAMLAIVMALSLTGTSNFYSIEVLAAPQQQTEETLEEVSINTLEEFLDFSKRCTAETYSKGKVFVLKTDLNLQGTEFSPIPVFAGTFDGNGHGIIGLSLNSAGSGLGLFRYVQENAVVKNLHVQGSLSPSGSGINIGGIAGVNRGTIENCYFDGHITAIEALGGIAGYNEATGIIRSCENKAVLTGNLKTGGITGLNEGLIELCINEGEVNTKAPKTEGASDSQPALGTLDLEENLRVERVNDAGGIAGLSSGTIRQCTNRAAVGYPHMGYNLGGIAGRQSGLIDNCVNYGKVQGRKDTGGIAGQFEPYLTVEYEEDMFGSLKTQMDELSQMGDAMSSLIENTGDTTSGNLDSIDSQLDKLKTVSRFYKDLFKKDGDVFDADAGRSLDEIQFALDRVNLDLVSGSTQARIQSAKETVKKMQQLRDQMKSGYEGDLQDVEALKAWLELRYEQLEQLSKYGESLLSDFNYILTHAAGDAIGGVEDFGDDLERVEAETNTFIDIVRINQRRIKTDMESMDEELTRELDILSWNMDTLSDNLKNNRNQLRSQKNKMKDQIDRMQDTITDGVDRLREDRDFFEDISDLETQTLEEGMVYQCANYGAVFADYQAGGIIGIIGTESGLDPELDLEAEEERTLNVTRNMKAIVSSCINRQEIQVKNDYAGGIVGKANLGALIGNQNYGDIVSEDGSFAGGITGSSAYILRNNYNMCRITGKDYTGGIAGWGTDLLQNYSMVSFGKPEGEWMGAIAGDVDKEGVIEGNVYVEEGIGAMDGITYEGQAEGLSYETFRNLEHIPKDFSHLTVEFLVEDRVIKTITCQYGSAISINDIPQAPQKDGYYYMWEEKDLSCLTGNEKVHAIYKAWNTTIASSQEKMPLMLVESSFYPGTSLTAAEKPKEDWKNRLALPEGFELITCFEYSIIQPEGVSMPESIKVHVLAEGVSKEAVAGIVENGSVCITDSQWDGSYLVFDMNSPGEIVILKPKSRLKMWIGIASSILILAMVLVFIGKDPKRKREAKNKPAPEPKSTPKNPQKPESES